MSRVSSAQATLLAIRGQLRQIKEFSEAHHADQPSGAHLHALLVDIPCYLALAIDQISRELAKAGTD